MTLSRCSRTGTAIVTCVGFFLLTACVRNPGTPPPPTPSTEKGAESKPESREEQIGRRLVELQPGMTHPQVEEILGPPNADEMQPTELIGLATASYQCVLPGNPTAGNRVMILYFDTTVEPPQFIEMTGPHPPGQK